MQVQSNFLSLRHDKCLLQVLSLLLAFVCLFAFRKHIGLQMSEPSELRVNQ